MENKYKIVFFTLLGMIIGGLVVTGVFLFNDKEEKKLDSNYENIKTKQESNINYSKPNDDYDTSDNTVEETNDSKHLSSNENNQNNESKEVSSNVSSNKSNNVSNSTSTTTPSNTTTNKSTTNSSVTSNTTTSSSSTSNTVTTSLSSKDNTVINYLKDKEQKVKGSLTKENAKALFIEVVDFLFYGGKIKGYTFNELTDKGKMEVSKLCTSVEIAIEKKYPGAIDETKTKYSEKKEKVIEKYNETINKFCTDREDVCLEFRKGYEDMKYSFGITFNILKDLGSKGLEKVDQWYQNFKNK